jgi:hypothetical protein
MMLNLQVDKSSMFPLVFTLLPLLRRECCNILSTLVSMEVSSDKMVFLAGGSADRWLSHPNGSRRIIHYA